MFTIGTKYKDPMGDFEVVGVGDKTLEVVFLNVGNHFTGRVEKGIKYTLELTDDRYSMVVYELRPPGEKFGSRAGMYLYWFDGEEKPSWDMTD